MREAQARRPRTAPSIRRAEGRLRDHPDSLLPHDRHPRPHPGLYPVQGLPLLQRDPLLGPALRRERRPTASASSSTAQTEIDFDRIPRALRHVHRRVHQLVQDQRRRLRPPPASPSTTTASGGAAATVPSSSAIRPGRRNGAVSSRRCATPLRPSRRSIPRPAPPPSCARRALESARARRHVQAASRPSSRSGGSSLAVNDDAMAIVDNKSLEDLDDKAISRLTGGAIRNWKELGGPDLRRQAPRPGPRAPPSPPPSPRRASRHGASRPRRRRLAERARGLGHDERRRRPSSSPRTPRPARSRP